MALNKFLSLLLLFITLVAVRSQAVCSPNAWCNIYFTNTYGVMNDGSGHKINAGNPFGVPTTEQLYVNNGWNRLVYVLLPSTPSNAPGGVSGSPYGFFLFNGQANMNNLAKLPSGTDNISTQANPESSSMFFTTTKVSGGQPVPYSDAAHPPFTEWYQAGENGGLFNTITISGTDAVNGPYSGTTQVQLTNMLYLKQDITASSATIKMCQGVPSGVAVACATDKGQSLAPTGTLWIDYNEAIDWGACQGVVNDPTGVFVANDPNGCTSKTNFCTAGTGGQAIGTTCTANSQCGTGGVCSRDTEFDLTVALDCGDGVSGHAGKPAGSTLCRGQKQWAGYLAARVHNHNSLAVANQCFGGTNNGNACKSNADCPGTNTNNPQSGLASCGDQNGLSRLATPHVLYTSGTGSPPTGTGTGIRYGARINKSLIPNTVNYYYGNTNDHQLDGPNILHNVGSVVYDPKRGKIWKSWGFQEVYRTGSLWFRCIFQPAVTVTSSDPQFSSCGANDVDSATNPKGWQMVTSQSVEGGDPGNYQENDMIYIPDPFDALFEFGGLKGGSTDDAWVKCLRDAEDSTTANRIAACHSDGVASNNASYISKLWMPVCNNAACQGTVSVPIHGRPGIRDGARMAWDNPDKKLLIVGGQTSQGTGTKCATGVTTVICWTSVAQWTPSTNNYCLSDTTQSGRQTGAVEFNAASGCSLPTLTGSAPGGCPLVGGVAPQEHPMLYFPYMAMDSTRNLLTLVEPEDAVGSCSGVYTYDPALNKWTRTNVTGGPPVVTTQITSKSMAYDSLNDMYTTIQFDTTMWEMPGSALGIAGPPPPRTTFQGPVVIH
jgi:hypothetical protein